MFDTAPILETDRLRLRPYKLEDFEAFARFYASQRSQHADGPVSRATAWSWFTSGVGRWALIGYGAWSIERLEDETCIGIVSLNHPIIGTEERELGWLLWDGFEGQGYATEAARLGRAFAFETMKWKTLVSYVSRENAASIRLAERLGAQLDAAATRLADAETLVYRHTP